jgi:ABC-type amino acid transport substrate-binding protein
MMNLGRLIWMSICVLLSAVSTQAADPPDIQRILDRGRLIVAMYYKDIPPFFMHIPGKTMPDGMRCLPSAEGNFCGVDVELALGIANKLGVICEFQRKAETFDSLIDILERHEADVAISLLSKTLDRARKVSFTKPYVSLYNGMLLNRLFLATYSEEKSLISILNQPSVKIGVKGGTSWVQYANRLFPKAIILEYPSWDPDVISAVRKGEVMAAYADEIEIKKVIIAKPDVAIELKTVVLKDITDPIAMAVPWDSFHLLQWLNAYMEEMKITMTTDSILGRYPESIKGSAEQLVSEEQNQ